MVATVLLYAYPTVRPLLIQDDTQILARSITWQTTWDNLWQPSNEHVMPWGRITTWLLIQLAGGATNLPYVAGLQGLLALLGGMVLTYFLVRRELGHPVYGLIALVFFGVSTVYQQAVYWFAASFAVLALDTLLLALLAAQRWRQTGRTRHLLLCVLWCFLAPGWFASGILAGPMCCLYLLWAREPTPANWTKWILAKGISCLPLLGSLLFLLLGLPRNLDRIMHLEHYGDRTAAEAFRPWYGLLYSANSLVENLVLGVVGLGGITLLWPIIVWGLLALAVLAGWWWRGVREHRLMVVGAGLILSSYWLIYSARAEWGYEGVMTRPHWSRYHLLPQLGLTLFLCAGLPRWQWESSALLSGRQMRWLLALVAVLFLLQLPRGLLTHWPRQMSFEEQMAIVRNDPRKWLQMTWEDFQNPSSQKAQLVVLQIIEDNDTLCRQHRISAATAREALGWLQVPLGAPSENGWNLLRGSDDPLPHRVEEARKLLGVPP